MAECDQSFFKAELADFKKEGFPVEHLKYSDNQPCLDLIEGTTPTLVYGFVRRLLHNADFLLVNAGKKRSQGIFSVLHEECSLQKGDGVADDEAAANSLAAKLHKELTGTKL